MTLALTLTRAMELYARAIVQHGLQPP